jgi:hypothetical protein
MRKRKRRSKGGGRYCHRFTGNQIVSDWSRMIIMNLGELKKELNLPQLHKHPLLLLVRIWGF